MILRFQLMCILSISILFLNRSSNTCILQQYPISTTISAVQRTTITYVHDQCIFCFLFPVLQQYDLPGLLEALSATDRIHLCLVNSVMADLHSIMDLGTYVRDILCHYVVFYFSHYFIWRIIQHYQKKCFFVYISECT